MIPVNIFVNISRKNFLSEERNSHIYFI